MEEDKNKASQGIAGLPVVAPINNPNPNIAPVGQMPVENPINNTDLEIQQPDLDTSHQRLGSVPYSSVTSPIVNAPALNSTENSFEVDKNGMVKKNNVLIAIILSILGLITAGLVLALLGSFLVGYKDNIYIDIAKTCPALKDNILKIAVDTSAGENVVATKGGELYYLYGYEKNSLIPYTVGDCYKISGASGITDVILSGSVVHLVFNDKTSGTYQISGEDGVYSATKKEYKQNNDYNIFRYSSITSLFDGTRNFPLTDEKYSANVAQYKIKNYLFVGKSPYFIDSQNNIYDKAFTKVINGSTFDSDIVPVSENDFIIVKSNKYVYIFDTDDKFQTKSETFYGIKASDINHIYLGGLFGKASQYFVLTNDGNSYRFSDVSTVIKGIQKTKYIIPVLCGNILCCLLVIILSYRGEEKKFGEGYKKMVLVMFIVTPIFNVLDKGWIGLLSIWSLVTPFISALLIFSVYFVVKKLIWTFMHKSRCHSFVLFATVYILLMVIFILLGMNALKLMYFS